GLVSGAVNTASRRALLEAVAAAIEAGAPVQAEALFAGRFVRPFRRRRKFFVNPCELAPADDGQRILEKAAAVPAPARAPAGGSALEVVRALVAQRAELPPAALSDDARLLADLHLNSIVVAQIATEAARQLGIAPPSAPLEYAGLTIAEMSRALNDSGSDANAEHPGVPDGIDAWVRPFRSRLVPRRSPRAQRDSGGGNWQFFGPAEGTLRSALEARRAEMPSGGGVVLCLPADPDERHAALLLEAGHAAVRLRHPARFLLVQHGGGAAALARSVHLEAHDLPVCVVDLPADLKEAVDLVAAEAAAARRYTEAHYDSSGARFEPALCAVTAQPGGIPLGPDDVLLVSGGAKGIGAECAVEAARMSGCRLALLGSSPAEHPEVEATLERMRALGLRAEYHRADVTDAEAVRMACGRIGRITAILHCAGINRPRPLEAMDEAGFRRTIEVKTSGLRNLLDTACPGLKLVVAFGSVIGRMGMQGEADYAVANEWMARDLERWGEAHPQCRCLTLEWSVWVGAGMGERVAHLESLRQRGVSPITIDEGLRAFREALCDASGVRTMVMTGRFGAPATLQFDAPELPLLRFLDRVRLHYPSTELICEADLSPASDPYLEDHIFLGARLLPGVMALEAMAQAASALAGAGDAPAFEDVHFARPVIVPPEGGLTIRLLALTRSDGAIEVRLRSAESGFRTDHFSAVCRFGKRGEEPAMDTAGLETVPLDPARDLYGGLLFQEGRFRRLRGYQRLSATECVAEAAAEEARGWFGRYLPQRLVLGDPGIRDTAIHAIQACIPHARVLPGGARRIVVPASAPAGPRLIRARELRREGDLLVYEMEIATPEGQVVERWSEMELRIVSTSAPVPDVWPPALLAPYLERRVCEIVPRRQVGVLLGTNGKSNGYRRPDGKPVSNGIQLSRAHAGNLTMTVTSGAPVGCDCEPVASRTASVWRDLLGPGGFALAELVSREAAEDLDHAATRVWCAVESMKKAGARQDLGIVLATPEEHLAAQSGWVVLGAGASRIATLIAPVAGFSDPVAFAVLVGA
ncbi:MAG TPA: SDR family NAD(P)-dependent oxidoreductase, partial [Candidatus Sulfopaludibacter sp.]|nr:SDR family NAD(P)-dependent oxidoreductase [Candidatus Sulfopaludibacter sp.]